MTEPVLFPDDEGPAVAARACALCGHTETDHEVRDVEGDLGQRDFCVECNDWHTFVPKDD